MKLNDDIQWQEIEIEIIKKIALEAGDAIMAIYGTPFESEVKDDQSPLTQADKKSNEIICGTLKKAFPTIPILSEENEMISFEKRKKWRCYWCIDPLDGTKEFIKKNGEFTVNIALIYQNSPVLGVVYAPALEVLYWAKQGQGAYKNGEKLPLHVNTTPEQCLSVVLSASHRSDETDFFIQTLKTQQIKKISKGSSLKLCMVAEGRADIYPRLAPTMEWDTAAADAIVREAGKMTYSYDLKIPLIYNKAELLNPWFIVGSLL